MEALETAWMQVQQRDDYERYRDQERARVAQIRARRRIRLTPQAVVLLENADTVRYQIQETLRCEGYCERRLARLVDEFAPLWPRPGELTATVMIDGDCPVQCRAVAQQLRDDGLGLRIAEHRCVSETTVPPLGDDDPLWYVKWTPSPGFIAEVCRGTAPVELGGAGRTVAVPRPVVLADLQLSAL